MSIKPKTRFDIFKRDNFTCRYCGRKTPAVVLELDHVIPQSKGGDSDPSNLVTSCYECNRGKRADLLEEHPTIEVDLHEKSVFLLERELQLKEYNALRIMMRVREDQEVEELQSLWNELYIAYASSGTHTPRKTQLKKYLRLFAVEDIKEAMEVTAEQPFSPYRGEKYFFGILRNWRKDLIEPEREAEDALVS